MICLPAAGCSGRSDTKANRPSKETVLTYGQAGTDSIIPSAVKTFTLGIAVQNRGGRDVVVHAFEVIDNQGVTARAELVVGPERKIGQVASAAGFPPDPSGRWDPAAPRPLGKGFNLPRGEQSARWGYNVLIRVDRTAEYGFTRGYRIRGTVAGKPFVDEVDTYVAFCGHAETATPACERYSSAHGYA